MFAILRKRYPSAFPRATRYRRIMIGGFIVAAISAGVFAVLCFSGCAHNKFSESLTELQDDGTPITTVTRYNATVVWPPFSKTGPVAHDFQYAWGGPENKIVSGQNTNDTDTTGQTEAVRAIGGVIGNIVGEAVKAYLSAQTAGATAIPAASTSAANLAAIVKQLQAAGLLKGTP